MVARTLSTRSDELSGPVRKWRTAEDGGTSMNSGRKGKREKAGFAGLEQNPPPMTKAFICWGNLSASLSASGVENDSAMMAVFRSDDFRSSASSEQSHLKSFL